MQASFKNCFCCTLGPCLTRSSKSRAALPLISGIESGFIYTTPDVLPKLDGYTGYIKLIVKWEESQLVGRVMYQNGKSEFKKISIYSQKLKWIKESTDEFLHGHKTDEIFTEPEKVYFKFSVLKKEMVRACIFIMMFQCCYGAGRVPSTADMFMV